MQPSLQKNKPTLNPALADFWRTVASIRVLYGGRDSTKSWDAAGFAIALAQMCKLKFMCCRQFQNRIADSVYTLLKEQIVRFGLQDDFIVTDKTIKHRYTGTEFIFYGLWRNVEDVRSTEGIDVLWIEEAQFLTKEQWTALEPTIRKDGSQTWLIFNPQLVTDFVWRRFVVDPPADTVVRKINHDENPFISEKSRKRIEALRFEDIDEYNHVYGGDPRSDDERVIIKREWIVAAIDAHIVLGIKPTGARRIGYDIADDGKDTNATVTALGILATSVQEWRGGKDDLLGSCKRVHLQARSIQAHIYYDNIGVGAFAGSKFKEINEDLRTRIGYTGFGAGEKKHDPEKEYQPGITNQDFFSNLKAQAWWCVADRFRNTYNAVTSGQKFTDDQLISINSNVEHLDRLIDELSTPRRDFDKAGRVKVESKKDLSDREVPSPNLADAFIMAYNPLIGTTINYGDLL